MTLKTTNPAVVKRATVADVNQQITVKSENGIKNPVNMQAADNRRLTITDSYRYRLRILKWPVSSSSLILRVWRIEKSIPTSVAAKPAIIDAKLSMPSIPLEMANKKSSSRLGIPSHKSAPSSQIKTTIPIS